ncbi:hypothetical protein KY360_01880 [Candidatus Woesearchaeota archaeon]|nr:hypothetical protein [Candidatus Woesearchaeota archaeon]
MIKYISCAKIKFLLFALLLVLPVANAEIKTFDNEYLANIFVMSQPGEITEVSGNVVIELIDTIYKEVKQISWSHKNKVIMLEGDELDDVDDLLDQYPSSMKELGSSQIIEQDFDPVGGIQYHRFLRKAKFDEQILGYYKRTYISYGTTINIMEADLDIVEQLVEVKGDGDYFELNGNVYYEYTDEATRKYHSNHLKPSQNDFHYFWTNGGKLFHLKFHAGNKAAWGREEDDEKSILAIYLEKYPSDLKKPAKQIEETEDMPETIEDTPDIQEPAETKKTITIKAYDDFLDIPVFQADVYIGNKRMGQTKRDGSIQIETEIPVRVKLKKDEYRDVIKAVSGDATINMHHKYEPFRVPKGYERYVNQKRIYGWVRSWYTGFLNTAPEGWIEIHPKGIRKYSFPMKSDDKITVLKDSIWIIKGFVHGSSRGWWPSDYEAIENDNWVCSDYATMTTSFGNSYNIPTRRVSIATKKAGLMGYWGRKEVKHAFSEAYIPEAGGWINYDATRGVVNEPCVYVEDAVCVYWAKADWETEHEVDVTEKYSCGKLCD